MYHVEQATGCRNSFSGRQLRAMAQFRRDIFRVRDDSDLSGPDFVLGLSGLQPGTRCVFRSPASSGRRFQTVYRIPLLPGRSNGLPEKFFEVKLP